MPIQQNTVIKFGTGEISVGIAMSSDRTKGAITLAPQEARPVGSETERPAPNEIPIIMEFSNVESIDAVLKQLGTMRKLMTGELSFDGDN